MVKQGVGPNVVCSTTLSSGRASSSYHSNRAIKERLNYVAICHGYKKRAIGTHGDTANITQRSGNCCYESTWCNHANLVVEGICHVKILVAVDGYSERGLKCGKCPYAISGSSSIPNKSRNCEVRGNLPNSVVKVVNNKQVVAFV